ncbi:hypothetical protein V8E54_013756 [Elaphomyces granulatus]
MDPNIGLFPIRYRRDFSVSGTGSAKLEPCRYMPDIVSAELTSYRYDIVKYRADICILYGPLEGPRWKPPRRGNRRTNTKILARRKFALDRRLPRLGGFHLGPSNHCPGAQLQFNWGYTTTLNSQRERPPLPRPPPEMSQPPEISQPRATATVATTATATAATTVTTIATATAAIAARTVAPTAAATAATTQPQKRGHPKGSKDKELRKRRQKATGGGDTRATGS